MSNLARCWWTVNGRSWTVQSNVLMVVLDSHVHGLSEWEGNKVIRRYHPRWVDSRDWFREAK